MSADVSLVRFGDAHIEATYEWLTNSAELRAQIDCLEPPTREGNREYWTRRALDHSREDYAITTSGRLHVGNCGLAGIDRARKKAELWIYLGAARGTGSGTQAVRALLRRAFEELHLHRVYLRVVSDNPRALMFYERLGFVIEGRFRDDTRHGDHWIDSVYLSILDDSPRALS